MKIILSPECTSLTGALDNYTGYYIRHAEDGFFAQRTSRGHVPPDGHWQFIVICAEQCQRGSHIQDISVGCVELITALHEAGLREAALQVNRPWYNAEQVLDFKTMHRL